MKRFVQARAAAFRGAIGAALLPLVLGGCATTGINKGQINVISTADEVKMGQEMSAEVAKQYTIYNNAAVTAYVQGVGNKIVQHCDRQDIEYHFAVINKNEVNAFAIPGGYIYVYTELMRDADDEAELAAVIAHEVGHVAARHSTERMTAMYGYQFVASLVLGQNPNACAKLVTDMAATGGFLKYSRKDEHEADELGAKYLYAAGYDPRGMVDLLNKLKGLETTEPTKFDTWFMTHPATSERLARVETEIAGFAKLTSPVRNAAAYAKIKAQLPK
ncbi:MAG: M48 family metallopeptidase [Candidatus Krumholzibacteria bacterium]|nr:M48 family metallopeptidase [Candidatus Krumholzibacteria bacterium]